MFIQLLCSNDQVCWGGGKESQHQLHFPISENLSKPFFSQFLAYKEVFKRVCQTFTSVKIYKSQLIKGVNSFPHPLILLMFYLLMWHHKKICLICALDIGDKHIHNVLFQSFFTITIWCYVTGAGHRFRVIEVANFYLGLSASHTPPHTHPPKKRTLYDELVRNCRFLLLFLHLLTQLHLMTLKTEWGVTWRAVTGRESAEITRQQRNCAYCVYIAHLMQHYTIQCTG